MVVISIWDKTVRAALLCVACDLPAAHKVCGFLSHSSHHACSRCTRYFPFNQELRKIMYSGFTKLYPPRTQSAHKTAGVEWLTARTMSGREEVEGRTGSRFTKLNLLSYFDCIRFTIIDPMHNLFLGTAKHVMKNVWISDELINQKHIERIHTVVQNAVIPSSVGRIPHKIMSGFAAFTADQWKNWSLLFSLVALHGILPPEHLECWRIFVQMCFLVCTPLISLNDVMEAGNLAIKFGKKFQSLYGRHRVTPNMHLHIHMQECMLDYGPVYGFWLYSFERFNGLLGNYHTNQRSIEIQVFRKFLNDMHVRNIALSDNSLLHDNLDLFNAFFTSSNGGSCADTIANVDRQFGSGWHLLFSLPTERVEQTLLYASGKFISALPPFKRRIFNSDSLRYLKEAYSYFLPVELKEIPASYEMYNNLLFWGVQIGSKMSRLERSSVVQAYWATKDGQITRECNGLCAGRVQFFFRQNILVEGERRNIIMASMQWFRHHPKRNAFGSPVEVWSASLHEPFGPASFIPVTRIKSLCVAVPLRLKGDNVFAVTPLRRKVFL